MPAWHLLAWRETEKKFRQKLTPEILLEWTLVHPINRQRSFCQCKYHHTIWVLLFSLWMTTESHSQGKIKAAHAWRVQTGFLPSTPISSLQMRHNKLLWAHLWATVHLFSTAAEPDRGGSRLKNKIRNILLSKTILYMSVFDGNRLFFWFQVVHLFWVGVFFSPLLYQSAPAVVTLAKAQRSMYWRQLTNVAFSRFSLLNFKLLKSPDTVYLIKHLEDKNFSVFCSSVFAACGRESPMSHIKTKRMCRQEECETEEEGRWEKTSPETFFYFFYFTNSAQNIPS